MPSEVSFSYRQGDGTNPEPYVLAIPDGDESKAVVLRPGQQQDIQADYQEGRIDSEEAWTLIEALKEENAKTWAKERGPDSPLGQQAAENLHETDRSSEPTV